MKNLDDDTLRTMDNALLMALVILIIMNLVYLFQNKDHIALKLEEFNAAHQQKLTATLSDTPLIVHGD